MSDPLGRRVALVYLTAQFQAAAIGVLLLALLPWTGFAAWRPDSLLLAALAVAAAISLVMRGLVARGTMEPSGAAMTAGLLVLAATLSLGIHRTGGLLSPLVLLDGALAVAAGMLLTPLANFFLLSGLCLLHTVVAMAGVEAAPAPTEAPFALLVIELGLIVLAGVVVNVTAGRLRSLQHDLAAHDLRDPATGLLRAGLFKARLLGLLEAARARGEGVGLLLVEAAPAAVARSAARLEECVRGEDLVGRIGENRFAVALPVATADVALRVAQRIARSLVAPGTRAGVAFGTLGEGEEPVDAARGLFLDAEERLARELSGFAA
jgi:hypothetical protein